MKRKIAMKNPDTLDTLIASKEQTDKALAELADELREKLNRLEAVLGDSKGRDGRLQTADGSRGTPAPLVSAAVSKLPSAVYCGVAVIALVGVFLLGQYIGGNYNPDPVPMPVPSPIPAPSGLAMTEREAELVRQAIDLVREDVDGLKTTARVLDALRSHLPLRVREAVMKELGEPDMEFMRDALDILEGKL